MNMYEFEYDTLGGGMNHIVSYQTNTLVEAIKKLKKNTRIDQLLGIKENGICLSKAFKGIYVKYL